MARTPVAVVLPKSRRMRKACRDTASTDRMSGVFRSKASPV